MSRDILGHLAASQRWFGPSSCTCRPCTGDTKPWSDHPADPQLNLTRKSEEFLQYIREVNTRLCVEYDDTGIIPMYIGEDWDEFNSEICPRHWKKRAKVTRGTR